MEPDFVSRFNDATSQLQNGNDDMRPLKATISINMTRLSSKKFQAPRAKNNTESDLSDFCSSLPFIFNFSF